MFAPRDTMYTTLTTAPGEIAFSWTMFLDIPIIVALKHIWQTWKSKINMESIEENSKTAHHDYTIGEQILLTSDNPLKLQ